MLCSACGKQVDDRAPFCYSCGAPVARVAPRSKNPAVMLVVAVVAAFLILSVGIVVLAIVVPKLGAAKMRSQEIVAIQNVRLINTAQVQYFTQYGRYPKDLSELAPPSAGPAGPSSAGLIPADLAAGTKSGYSYTLHVSPTGYTLNPDPVSYNSTGRRTFFGDESVVLRAHWGPEPAPAASVEP